MTKQRLEEVTVSKAYRVIASHLFRKLGDFAYQSFDFINANYFSGAVPETHILWDITKYGKQLGWCRSSSEGPPIIKLHPSLVSPTQADVGDRGPWKIPFEHFGHCLAFDVLLHEMIHAHVNYNLGGEDGCAAAANGPTASRSLWTCHNCPNWINECNRIGKLLGLNVDAQMTVSKRVGKKVERVNGGNCCPETFPIHFRKSFYLAKKLPWE